MARYALVAILSLCPALAAAQSSSDTKAAADALFDDGKRLLNAGEIDRACAKFEASLQLRDQLGVRLNLADCHERQGSTATAWAEFREASSLAERHGDKRAAYARQRAEALAPRLTKLEISVAQAHRVPGLAIRRDGNAVPAEAFDTPLPVNPGRYTIDASAPGYQTWSTHAEANKPGEIVTLEVPALVAVAKPEPIEPAEPAPRVAKPAPSEPAAPAKLPAQSTARTAPATADNSHRKRQVLGIGVGAAGMIVIGAGVVIGSQAKSKWDTAGIYCMANVCDATGVSINNSAKQLGNIGTIVGGVGLAAVITGGILYVTAPAARPVIEHARLDTDPRTGARVVSFASQF